MRLMHLTHLTLATACWLASGGAWALATALPAASGGAPSAAAPFIATDRAVPALAAASARRAPRPAARWIQAPRLTGRITAKDIGLVINSADPYSVEVGAYYIKARKLTAAQVLRVELPLSAALTPSEFAGLERQISARFGASTQALALAWVTPYAVACNSITGAIALGFDPGLCANSCAPSKVSPYFNAATARPFSALKLRPSMLLAARDVDGAKAMIDRGVASDRSLGLRGGAPAQAYFLATADHVRSVRAALFPPAGTLPRLGVAVHVESAQSIENVDGLLVYETGLEHVEKLDTLKWLPGALADHLTSFGGQLVGASGQMSVLAWIASGATASYGTVSEPCSYVQKFPHPQVLMLHYLQGSSALEAYWKSVAWPQQGVFVGEPLAAPYARR